MLNIDQLALHLPAGFEQRAEQVARLMIHNLGQIHMTKELSLSQLSLPPMVINPAQSDQQIAQQITGSLLQTLKSKSTATNSAVPSVPSASGQKEHKPC